MRVLKWMIDRLEGKAVGEANIFGVSPTYTELNWTGLDFSAQQFQEVISINKEAWREELKLHDELFTKLAHNLPKELVATKQKLESALG